MDPAMKGIPLDSEDLLPVLTEIAVKHFHGKVNAEYVADQTAWEKARDEQGGLVPKTVEYAPKAGKAAAGGTGLERRFW